MPRLNRQTQKPVYDTYYRAIDIAATDAATAKKLNKTLLNITFSDTLSVTYVECQNPETATSPIGAWTTWTYPLISGTVIGLLKVTADTNLTSPTLAVKFTMADNLEWILRIKNKYIGDYKEGEAGKRQHDGSTRGRGRGRGYRAQPYTSNHFQYPTLNMTGLPRPMTQQHLQQQLQQQPQQQQGGPSWTQSPYLEQGQQYEQY